MGPRVALVVVDEKLDGFACLPAGAGERYSVAGRIVGAVAGDRALIGVRNHSGRNQACRKKRSQDETDLEQPPVLPGPGCWP